MRILIPALLLILLILTHTACDERLVLNEEMAIDLIKDCRNDLRDFYSQMEDAFNSSNLPDERAKRMRAIADNYLRIEPTSWKKYSKETEMESEERALKENQKLQSTLSRLQSASKMSGMKLWLNDKEYYVSDLPACVSGAAGEYLDAIGRLKLLLSSQEKYHEMATLGFHDPTDDDEYLIEAKEFMDRGDLVLEGIQPGPRYDVTD